MNKRIFEAFLQREQEVKQYMAGCGMKYGMECSCGPSCTCADCPIHSGNSQDNQVLPQQTTVPSMALDTMGDFDEGTLQIDQPMQLNFGMDVPSTNVTAPILQPLPFQAPAPAPSAPTAAFPNQQMLPAPQAMPNPPAPAPAPHSAMRNPSILSYRGSIRHNNMSITSETFGRAMSGLSALSIDWENLEDFDVDLDHSANIQQHRASTRRPVVPTADPTDQQQQQQHSSYNV